MSRQNYNYLPELQRYKSEHYGDIYQLVIWDGSPHPRHVLECSAARGETGARLFLFACVPFKMLREMDPRRLDQVLFGFEAPTQ